MCSAKTRSGADSAVWTCQDWPFHADRPDQRTPPFAPQAKLLLRETDRHHPPRVFATSSSRCRRSICVALLCEWRETTIKRGRIPLHQWDPMSRRAIFPSILLRRGTQSPTGFRVVSLPILGALHHDYRLARAALTGRTPQTQRFRRLRGVRTRARFSTV